MFDRGLNHLLVSGLHPQSPDAMSVTDATMNGRWGRLRGGSQVPWIGPYRRADGTQVKGHSRWAAGARREMAIIVVAGLVVVAGGNTTPSKATDGKPYPRPTAGVYPVKFPGWEKPRPLPKPTVSYPIRFPSPRGKR